VNGYKVSRPAEPKQGYWQDQGAQACWRQLSFRGDVTVLLVVLVSRLVHPGEIPGDRDKSADKDPEKSKTSLTGIKAMDLAENYRICFEEGVENPIEERNVAVEKEDNGFSETQCEWSNETFESEVLHSD
jgi:hypothetical protein